MTRPRAIISVHAHPDDEASKGAAIIAKYKDLGARAILITATGGEEGEILNPVMDTVEVRENLVSVRLAELELAAKIIGYDRLEMLGYRDSGMPDSAANQNPASFAKANLEEAAGKIALVIRQERPDVMLTYPEIQTRYPHPDHLRVYDVSIRARELAADEDFPGDGLEPYEVQKVYFHIWTRERMFELHQKFGELGFESPYSLDWFEGVVPDYEANAKIPIHGYFGIRSRALRAHATQIDPESMNWFGLSDEQQEDAYPSEDLFLAIAPEGYEPAHPETDIFAGLV